jgi:hypothetical protein
LHGFPSLRSRRPRAPSESSCSLPALAGRERAQRFEPSSPGLMARRRNSFRFSVNTYVVESNDSLGLGIPHTPGVPDQRGYVGSRTPPPPYNRRRLRTHVCADACELGSRRNDPLDAGRLQR